MALPLGKLTILVGAGIVGSIIAKEGRVSDVPNFVSGAFKFVWKQLKSDDSTPAIKKPRNDTPRNDALVAQVNTLRRELELIVRDRNITIVNTTGTGVKKYGVVIIIIVVGYGYIWWKGWKLPDLMVATRRNLSDACSSISKSLENMHASLAAAKRQLSSRVAHVESHLEKLDAVHHDTIDELSGMKGTQGEIDLNFNSLQSRVQILESCVTRIQGMQDATNKGVQMLCEVAHSNFDNNRTVGNVQAIPSSSSRLSIEPPLVSPSLRTGSLPPDLSPQSPSQSNGSHQVQRPLQHAATALGLQETSRILEVPHSSNGHGHDYGTPPLEEKSNGSSSFGLLETRPLVTGASYVSRTRSAIDAVLKHARAR